MNLHGLDSFCEWLAATQASQTLQSVGWIIPAVQTVHILCVAAVMSSVLVIDLRLLGVWGRDVTIAALVGRFTPFIWWPLPLLLVTGAMLIIAEPQRALENPVFVLKMALLAGASGITLACQLPLRRNPGFWNADTAHRRAAACVALCSLPLWVGIVFAGRWIAYVQVS
jgi:hypothetical protein